MWNKFCTCFMIFSTFFGLVQWKICEICINSIMFIFWDVIVCTLVDIYRCSVLSLAVSVKSAGSSEVSVNFYQITWHDIVDDITWIAWMVLMSEVLWMFQVMPPNQHSNLILDIISEPLYKFAFIIYWNRLSSFQCYSSVCE